VGTNYEDARAGRRCSRPAVQNISLIGKLDAFQGPAWPARCAHRKTSPYRGPRSRLFPAQRFERARLFRSVPPLRCAPASSRAEKCFLASPRARPARAVEVTVASLILVFVATKRRIAFAPARQPASTQTVASSAGGTRHLTLPRHSPAAQAAFFCLDITEVAKDSSISMQAVRTLRHHLRHQEKWVFRRRPFFTMSSRRFRRRLTTSARCFIYHRRQPQPSARRHRRSLH